MFHSDSNSIPTARRRLMLAVAGLITLIMAASSLSLAARANAEPVGDGSAASTCSYGGDTYNTGDRISVISGATYTNYYCGSDGNWHKVEQDVNLHVHVPPRAVAPVAVTKARVARA